MPAGLRHRTHPAHLVALACLGLGTTMCATTAPPPEPPLPPLTAPPARVEPPVDTPCTRARAQREQARSLEQEGRLAEARSSLRDANAACPAEALSSARTELSTLLDLGETDEARTLAARVKGDPNTDQATSRLADQALAPTPTRLPGDLLKEARAAAAAGIAATRAGTPRARAMLDRAAALAARASGKALVLETPRALEFIRDLRWSADGRTIAAADQGDVILFDAGTLHPTAWLSLGDAGHPVIAAGFSGDGRLVAAASYGAYAKVWEVATGLTKGETTLNVYPPASFAFAPDGKSFAEIADHSTDPGSRETDLEFARLGEKATEWVWSTHKDRFWHVDFTPDGTSLLASGSDRVRILDAGTGKPRRTLAVAKVFRAALRPDGKLLATVSTERSDTAIRLWSAATGGLVRKLEGHRDRVYDIAFSPDGGLVVAGSFDDSFSLWDAASGAKLHASSVGSDVMHVAFSPDGNRLAIALANEVQVWDRASWTSVRTLVQPHCRAGELVFPQAICEGARVAGAAR